MHLSRLLTVTAATAALLVPALPASAAHESNNKATLAGEGVTGTAIVNYVEGRTSEQWTANARVRGLAPGEYTYVLVSPPDEDGAVTDAATVCSFVVDGPGSAGCSSSSFDTGGFLTAEIRDDEGEMVVASGTFARRGGQRAGG